MTDHVSPKSVLDLADRISHILEAHRYMAGKEQPLREHLESAGLHEAGDKHLVSAGVYPDPDQVADLLRECLLVLADLYPVVGAMLRDCYPELLPPDGTSPGGPGVKLYRGETPGAPGLDIYGGEGQHWTTDPDQAGGYAKGPDSVLRRAWLPPNAKRLVLVDPVSGEYNWQGLADLEAITGDELIISRLRAGHQLYDVWCPEWTRLLKEAGYESIASVGIEGPEEYVLNPALLIELREGGVEL
jgi:hypothetical protein